MVLLVLSARTHVYAAAAKIPENKPANDGIIDDENSGFTIKSIPKIAIIIAVI